MTLAPEALDKLTQPLDPTRVKKREGGGGRSLSYLEGHDVIRTANDIFGIGGWGYQVTDLACLGEESVTTTRNGQTKTGWRVAYRATVSANVNGVGYSDVGYGDAVEYTGSKLTPHELASKEAVTDALKRALKNLGDQFGLCLYDRFAPEHDGRSARPVGRADSSAGGGQGGAATPPAAPPDTTRTFQDGDFVSPPVEALGNGFGLAAEIDASPGGKKYAGLQVRDLKPGQLKWFAGLWKPDDGEFWQPRNPAQQLLRRAVVAFMADPSAVVQLAEPDGFGDPDADVPFDRTIDGLGN